MSDRGEAGPDRIDVIFRQTGCARDHRGHRVGPVGHLEGGKGDAGVYEGSAGDLLLRIQITPDKTFKRVEDDLVCKLLLTYPQLVFGCQVEVESIDGTKHSIKIPRGCAVGERVIIPEKGFNRPRGSSRGSLIIITECHIPNQLSPDAKDLLQDYAKIVGTEIPRQQDGFIASFFKRFSG